MTREGAIQFLDNMRGLENGRAIGKDGFFAELCGYHVQALNIAIKALEQEPCEDVISRQAAINCFKGKTKFPYFVDSEPFLEYLQGVVDAIKDLPTVKTKQRWIPVSEKLPKDRKPVLVTAYWHETYQDMVGSYFGNGDWWCAPWNNTGEPQQLLKVKAWMPLPEPYKESEEQG